MTVATTTITAGPYAGNGLAVEFAFGFRVDDEAELLVFETDDTGAVTTLELGTDYTVAGVGNDEGGTVTRVAGALPLGYSWYIRRSTPQTQPTNFNSQGGFFPDVHEAAFDRLTYMVQELEDRIERAARFADSYSGTVSLTLPEPESAAFLRWNEAGDALMNDPSIGAVEGALPAIVSLSQVIPEIEGVYAIRSDVTTVAGIAADVTTVAGIAANVTAVAGISAEIQTCAANIADIQAAPGAATTAQQAKTDAENARDLAEQYRDEAQAAGYDSTNVAITGGTINGTNINYNTVSKGEAEAGTSSTVRNWTAQRVKQAIVALAPPSGLVLLASATASNDAVVDFTAHIDSTYDEYVVRLLNVIPATDATTLHLRTSSNGGSSFDGGTGHYSGICYGMRSSLSTLDRVGTISGTYVQLSPLAVGSASNEMGASLDLHIIRPSEATFTMMHWSGCLVESGAGETVAFTGAGRRNFATVVNAIRFFFDTGDIKSGIFHLYGVRRA